MRSPFAPRAPRTDDILHSPCPDDGIVYQTPCLLACLPVRSLACPETHYTPHPPPVSRGLEAQSFALAHLSSSLLSHKSSTLPPSRLVPRCCCALAFASLIRGKVAQLVLLIRLRLRSRLLCLRLLPNLSSTTENQTRIPPSLRVTQSSPSPITR